MANGRIRSHHPDIHVFRFEDVGSDAVQQTPLFKTNFYQIGLFKQVQFEVSYFGTTKSITKQNAVVLFKPGQTISFSKADPQASGYAVMFREFFIEWRLDNLNTLKDFSILKPDYNCVFFVDDTAFGELLDVAEKMHHEYKENLPHYSSNILSLYCQILIEKINRLNSESVIAPQNSIQFRTTQDFKSLVFHHIHSTKTVADYAEMLSVTEKTLIAHVKQTIGHTPKEFINLVVAEESKAMLVNKATVDQVSTYFNFTDQAHFSNFFRKMTGKTPREFKKQ